jgi:hypothetical protein
VQSSDETQGVDRVASADNRDGLERINGSEVLRAGGVNLIGLDAIRNQLGERWRAKAPRIWEHVDRELARKLSPHDMYFRLDEVNYLIAMPLVTRFMAQAACLSILQEILKFFLGESNLRDVVVRTVTSIEAGQVMSAPLDLQELAEAGARAMATPLVDQPAPAANWKPPLAGRAHSLVLQSEARRPIEVKMGVEAVWNLRRGLITSFVLDRAVSPPVELPLDVLKVDGAVMAYAAELLKEHHERGGRLTLHLPISYSTAAARRTRETALSATAPFRELMRQTVLLEIVDLDPGVPASRLVDTVALLKPFCLGVLARVKPTRKALETVKACGLQGVVLDAHNLGRTTKETAALLQAFAAAARGTTSNVIVHGLAERSHIDLAQATGMTHASLRPQLSFETIIDAA